MEEMLNSRYLEVEGLIVLPKVLEKKCRSGAT
jgi:hypothetical protein